MPAKESQKEDWKKRRVDPDIVNAKPLNFFEQRWQQNGPPPPGGLPGAGVVIHRGGEPGPENDPRWQDSQLDPMDYILRLMNAAGKDTKNKRSHRPLTEKRGKRTGKPKTYRERLHGIFGSEEP